MTGEVSGDLTGRRLGNYRIDSVLGQGGMSVTYQATDVRLGRKVALKVIGDHLGADAEFRERFVDEARNTSAIDHANIVPLYDFGELEGMLYIAMRMVDGGDLAGLISGGPVAPARALSLLDQVADALDTLHNRGLVHLDVKPANVLVTSRETSREHVYVADFGLTRRGATGHRTRGGDFLGSPTYAAPEHLRGEPLDGRTDQYALTCVLFACLTGSPPFKGDVPTVIKGHLNGEPPSVSRVVGLPAALDDVVRRGMAKNPADRYPNCVALVAAARTALGPMAASDTPPGPPGSPPVAGVAPSAAQPGAGQPAAGQPSAVQSSAGRPVTAQQGSVPQNAGAGGPGSGWGAPGQSNGSALTSPLVQPNSALGQRPGAPYGQPSGYGGHPGRPAMASPGFPPQNYGGYPGQPGYGPPQNYGPPGDPMRLRPPSPAGGPSAFQQPKGGGGLKWLWIGLGVLVLAGVVVGAIFLFGDTSDSGGDVTPTTAPEIPVGPGGSPPTAPSSALQAPPTSISIHPSH
ncbi:serine/threonine-protein kinase [Amycolatopsis sp. PS_44_ISF1]|uniref:serine/threonine-protein kinase n=1 Tax=Amycolatopsis sp. PS_44_ISF1 TaxID=2974917 RepID=UPI0028DE4995|nr:serine/threonine-protein kinase [Amycolatopsis sp. PS_44_ISF1]MDT8911098.1 protein kinase [Amycolatopsis sp. PS_44_ISF1]